MEILNDIIVTSKTGILARSKGFQLKTEAYCNRLDPKETVYIVGAFNHNYAPHGNVTISLPTQSALRKWLWDEFKIWIEITLWGDGIGFVCTIKQSRNIEGDGPHIVREICIVDAGVSEELHNDPYKLLEKGLQEALNLI